MQHTNDTRVGYNEETGEVISMRNNHKNLLPAIIALCLLLAFLPGCGKKRTPDEELTLQRVRDAIMPFILAYPESHFQFAESTEEMLRAGLVLPINPYTGETMVDTGSSEFDKATSPGNFHYAVVKDPSGQTVNFSVYVWGERGLIRHIRPSPMAPT
jgi:hypothetical protein